MGTNDKVLNIGKGIFIAGARLGDKIEVLTITGLSFNMVFLSLNQFGIEGHNVKWDRMQFIPFASILTIMKTETKQELLPDGFSRT